MNKSDFNLEKIREELEKYTNIEHLKKEFAKLESKVRNFDLHTKLSPEAKRKLEVVEKKYNEVVKAISDVQKKVDSEIAKAVSTLKKTRDDAEMRLGEIRSKAASHTEKIKAKMKETEKPTAPKTTKKKAARKVMPVTSKKKASAKKKAKPSRV